jgi:hypothetical protein
MLDALSASMLLEVFELQTVSARSRQHRPSASG